MAGLLPLRIAAAAALALSLALAGCGRKGPLDPPPRSNVAQGESEPQPAQQVQQWQPQEQGFFGQPDASRNLPPNPVGRKKPFLLDPLLN